MNGEGLVEGSREEPISQKYPWCKPHGIRKRPWAGAAALGGSPGEALEVMDRVAASYELPGDAGKSWRTAAAGEAVRVAVPVRAVELRSLVGLQVRTVSAQCTLTSLQQQQGLARGVAPGLAHSYGSSAAGLIQPHSLMCFCQ